MDTKINSIIFVSLVGVEPTVFRLEGGRVIHCATGTRGASLQYRLQGQSGREYTPPHILCRESLDGDSQPEGF